MTLAFQPVLFPVSPSKPLALRKKGFCKVLLTGNPKCHSPPKVGQECSVIKKRKGELSSVAGKLHLSYGTEKDQEVRQGHLAELSHFLLRTFWSGPCSPHDSSRQPGPTQEQASEGWADINREHPHVLGDQWPHRVSTAAPQGAGPEGGGQLCPENDIQSSV